MIEFLFGGLLKPFSHGEVVIVTDSLTTCCRVACLMKHFRIVPEFLAAFPCHRPYCLKRVFVF